MQTNLQRDVLVLNIERRFTLLCDELYEKSIGNCSDQELYFALITLVKELTLVTERLNGEKKVFYVSAEFLIGRLLSNNLLNLGLYDTVQGLLAKNGKDLATITEMEPEPSLGNGGLGRLAACFLDSITTLGIPGEGMGLYYHFGLFRQEFSEGCQKELPDKWREAKSWLKGTSIAFPVFIGKNRMKLMARVYNLDVIGYANGVNRLRLFDLDTVDEGLVKEGIQFDQEDIAHNLTLFLYPDDATEAGKKLRICQQYFLASATAQLILLEMHENKHDLRHLYDYAAIQINDTHPTLIIPELLRILVEEKAIPMEEAILIVTKTCGYTNHTILAEALETWPLSYLEETVPQLVPIIKELDRRVKAKWENPSIQIIDENQLVHMAYLDIHYTHSVNGVARIHTDILKTRELADFHAIYPEKFTNKTNGISFRRWLVGCNRELSDFLTERIGYGFKRDALQLERLMEYIDDEDVLQKIENIKQLKKEQLCAYIEKIQGIRVNPHSIFDMQIKRFHEYKRQQMNALYLIHKYLEIKRGKKPVRPITCWIGGKTAPSYVAAKDVIHLLLVLQTLIQEDPAVSPYLQLIMVENYNVTWAEKMIPACDISEQISLASKEASGTGNMKFMLNGGITLGTEDGANVEIHELVGEEAIEMFGLQADRVMELEADGSYRARDYYEKSELVREVVDFLGCEELLEKGNPDMLVRLQKELLENDRFMTLADFEAYCAARERLLEKYENRPLWRRNMLINIAKAGYFSSDRTILEYNQDIWNIPIQGMLLELNEGNKGLGGF